MRIKALEENLKYLKEQYEAEETFIMNYVKTDWSSLEVSEAKLKALDIIAKTKCPNFACC